MTSGIERDWLTVHTPPESPGEVVRQRRAARRIAEFAATLPRLSVRLVEHFDYDRLRVNVYSLVAPGLVTWR